MDGLEDILGIIEGMYQSATTSLLAECEADIELLHKTTGSVGLKVQGKVACEHCVTVMCTELCVDCSSWECPNSAVLYRINPLTLTLA